MIQKLLTNSPLAPHLPEPHQRPRCETTLLCAAETLDTLEFNEQTPASKPAGRDASVPAATDRARGCGIGRRPLNRGTSVQRRECFLRPAQ